MFRPPSIRASPPTIVTATGPLEVGRRRCCGHSRPADRACSWKECARPMAGGVDGGSRHRGDTLRQASQGDPDSILSAHPSAPEQLTEQRPGENGGAVSCDHAAQTSGCRRPALRASPDVVVFPGEGVHSAEVAELVCRLDKQGYRGDYSFEVFNDDYTQLPLPLVAARARRSVKWITGRVSGRSLPVARTAAITYTDCPPHRSGPRHRRHISADRRIDRCAVTQRFPRALARRGAPGHPGTRSARPEPERRHSGLPAREYRPRAREAGGARPISRPEAGLNQTDPRNRRAATKDLKWLRAPGGRQAGSEDIGARWEHPRCPSLDAPVLRSSATPKMAGPKRVPVKAGPASAPVVLDQAALTSMILRIVTWGAGTLTSSMPFACFAST